MLLRQILFLALSLSSSVLLAQPTVLFHENFDLPSGADSVSSGIAQGVNPTLWQVSNQLNVSPSQSYHLQGSEAGSRVYFETDAFSTIGYPFIVLRFSHIAKIYRFNTAKVYYSTDNGATWSLVPFSSYMGEDGQYGNISNTFNEVSYGTGGIHTEWHAANPNALPSASWWRPETFDLTGLLTDTSQGLSNAVGYPNVKLRFEANFSSTIPQSANSFGAGWFIDNIKVEGGTCNPIGPMLNFDYNPIPCFNNNPQGLLEPGTGNFRIAVEASSPGAGTLGLNGVDLIYRLNGTPWNTVAMQQITGTNEYDYIISNLQNGDTIDYYVESYDLCTSANYARIPAQSGNFYRFRLDNLANKCISGNCHNNGIIDQFPWSEDFESVEWKSGYGNGNAGNLFRGVIPGVPGSTWITGPPLSANYGFCVRQGSTGTSDTGPDQNYTPDGHNYLYTEFSQASSQQLVSFLITPCIDLRQEGAKVLSFRYHMYGSDINRLQIDVDTGSAGTSFQHAIWQKSGPQQATSGDAWNKGQVNLTPYLGKIIRLRFTTFRQASGDKANVAIDQLKISTPPNRDLEVSNVPNPLESQCSPNNQAPVEVQLFNQGQDTLYSIPMAYQLNNNAIVRDTLKDTIYSIGVHEFTFTNLLNFSASSSHSLRIWHELAGDVNPNNDTLNLNLPPRLPTIDQFPYIFDFEDGQPATGNPGNLNSPFWIRPSSQRNANWHVSEGLMNDRLEEPTYGLGPRQRYLLLRTTGTGIQEAEFQSTCIELDTLRPELSFQASVYEADVLKIYVKSSLNYWQNLRDVNPVPASNLAHMTHYKADLSAFQGEVIQLKFTASDSGTSLDKAIALDNIMIKDALAIDYALTGINRAARRLQANNTNLAQFDLNIAINHDRPTLQTFNGQIGVIFIDECDPLQIYQTTVSVGPSDLNPAPHYGSCAVNFSLPGGVPAGRYHTKLFLDLPVDSISYNDTLAYTTVFHQNQDLPYQNNFDSCYGDFAATGDMLQWERGQATRGSPSGNTSWVTNLDANLVKFATAILRTPIFSGVDTLKNVRLNFWHRYNFPTSPDSIHGRVEYFNPNTTNWEVLQSADPGDLWYNGQNTNGIGTFTGISNGWQEASVNTGHLPIGTDLILRFVARGTVTGHNWEIDDLELTIPPQYSVAPVQFLTDGNMPLQGTSFIPEVKIANSGLHSVDSLQIELFDQNGISLHQQSLNISPALPPGENRVVALNTNLPFNANLKSLMIVTSQPNGRQDDIPRDDTLIQRIFYLADTIDQWPYCQDFDTSSTFVGFNTNGQYDSQWKYGFPGNAVINGPYSGLNAWYTSDSTYAPMSDNYLYTPRFSLPGNECYHLSFQHWVDTELHLDGGQVEFTTNGGLTWGQLGGYNDSGWYNVPFIQAFGGLKPGFSGHSGGWQAAFIDFHLPAEAELQLRFHFASNASVEYDGWAIDDFCLEALGYSACSTIGEKEFNPTTPIINLYPNPTQDELNLIFLSEVKKATSCLLEVYSSSGQRLREWQATIAPGKEHSIPVGELPKGVYSLRVIVDGQQQRLEFVKH